MHQRAYPRLAFIVTATYLKKKMLGDSPGTTLRKGATHGECTNFWGLTVRPDEKTLLLARFWRAMIENQQQRAERSVAQYLASTGYRFTDDAERQIERRLFKSSLSS